MDLDSARGLHDLINGNLSKTAENTVMLPEAELRRMGRSMGSLFADQVDSRDDKTSEHVNQFLTTEHG